MNETVFFKSSMSGESATPNDALPGRTLGELVAGMQAKRFSALELVLEYVARIEALDPELKNFITVTSESAAEAARKIDAGSISGKNSRLAGIPLALKDNIATQGIETTCASQSLLGFIPREDAEVTRRLKQAGSILLGKLNLDEFALGTTSETSAFGTPKNPWNEALTPGGSSGGSAAAVAGGLCAGSLGTDTGGSIRQPAAFCGIVGLKPTVGEISMEGVIPLSSLLDCVGPLGRCVRDVALLFHELAQPSLLPPFTRSPDLEKFDLARNPRPLVNKKLGIPRALFYSNENPVDVEVLEAFNQAITQLERLGAEILEVDLPHFAECVFVYGTLLHVEIFQAYASARSRDGEWRAADGILKEIERFFDETGRTLPPALLKRMQMGAHLVQREAHTVKEARRLLDEIKWDFKEVFFQCHAVLTPTSPVLPFARGQSFSALADSDFFTRPANLAGLPAISLPCGFASEGRAIGLQILAPARREDLLLQIAYAYEQSCEWWHLRPKLARPFEVGR